jgi:imidazolonepropionase-like amidohydrolase
VAAAVVDSVIALGVDFLKVRETANLNTYRAIAAAARARGVSLAGHAPFGMDVAEGARLGLTTFEHASYPYPLDTVPSERRRILSAFLEGGTAVVPTMVAWSTQLMDPDSLAALIADSAGHRDPRRVGLAEDLVQEWRFEVADMTRKSPAELRGWCGFVNRTLADLAALHRAGVPILAGTDVGLPGLLPGWSLHDELRVLVEGGVLSAADAIRSATALAARYAGQGDVLGTVEPGRFADLLVLEGDPTVDIAVLRRPSAVIRGGVPLGEAQLAQGRSSTTASRNGPIDVLPGVAEAGCGVLRP